MNDAGATGSRVHRLASMRWLMISFVLVEAEWK